MAEAERQSATPEVAPAGAVAAPAGPAALLTPRSYGVPASLVGALAAGSDEWRADVIQDLQRTSGNRAVMRMLDLGAPTLARAPTANAAADKATGMARRTGNMASGALDARKHQWKGKSSSERAQAVAAAAFAALAATGCPRPPRLVLKNGMGVGNASFSASTWSMDIDRQVFADPDPGENHFSSAAGSIAHEVRHAEQSWREARLLAGRGRKLTAITDDLGIPRDIADAAIKNPLKSGSPEAREAKDWYDSLDDAGKVYEKLDKAQEKLDAALAAYHAAKDERAIHNARQAYFAAEKVYKRAYRAYRRLPEEADAWRVGTRVRNRIRKGM